MLLPETRHLRNVDLQWSLDLFYTIPMCLLALLDMFQIILHHKHVKHQLYWRLQRLPGNLCQAANQANQGLYGHKTSNCSNAIHFHHLCWIRLLCIPGVCSFFGRSGLTKTFYWPPRALAGWLHTRNASLARCLVHCMSILIVSMHSIVGICENCTNGSPRTTRHVLNHLHQIHVKII